MDLQQELFAVLDALTAARIEHAICGGFAVAIHGYPRLTKDIDLLIQQPDLERARTSLATLGYTLDAGLLTFAAGTSGERRLGRVSKTIGSDLITVDLLLVEPLFGEVWRGREQHQLPGRTVTVISRAGLARMKRAAGRPRDLDDLQQLGIDPEPSDGP